MNRMRERRRALGLTMKQLGAIVGVSEGAISHYETGRREPDPDMLKSLASALDVSVDYILERDQDKQARNQTEEPLSPSSIIPEGVEIRVLARGGKHLTPEQIKKRNELINMLMEMDDEDLDKAEKVIDIYRKK